jgi:hypothetical protein
MNTRSLSTAMLAAATVVGLGIAPALAASPEANSGYAVPNFWGSAAAQQAQSAPAQNHADGAAIGAYVTQTSHGTWLFPPNPNGGGVNG